MDTHPQCTDPSAEKTHESTSHDLGHTPAYSTASSTIKPGDPVYKEMTFDGTQTAIATIGGRIKLRGQDFLMTAARPFTDRLPIEKNDREKKASPEWLLIAGSLYYSSHSNGHPELNYALIRPRPDIHVANNVELVPSPWHSVQIPAGSVQLPAFTSAEEFSHLRNVQTSVRAVTASAGEVVGVLNPIPGLIACPMSSGGQKVYEVNFTVPLAPGDEGAWAFDASNGKLLGHIILKGEFAMIIPAYEVFEDLSLSLFLRPECAEYLAFRRIQKQEERERVAKQEREWVARQEERERVAKQEERQATR
jgi:hypothetical protein